MDILSDILHVAGLKRRLLDLHALQPEAALRFPCDRSFGLHAVTRGRITKPAIAAQCAFMVLFSYSFFFEGYTGLTITIAAVITLALLMRATARINWASRFAGVPPLPRAAA